VPFALTTKRLGPDEFCGHPLQEKTNVPATSPAAGARAAPVAAATKTNVTTTTRTFERVEPTVDHDSTIRPATVGGLAVAFSFLMANRNVLVRTFPKLLPHELRTTGLQ
jgi:hypothetical protein